MSFDAAYEALTDHDDDARWAYGTGFADPMAGVPTDVPDTIDREFERIHDERFGQDSGFRQGGVQLTGFQVHAVAATTKPDLDTEEPEEATAPDSREVYWSELGEAVATPIHRMEVPQVGGGIHGPALVELPESVIVIRPGQSGAWDDLGNFVVEMESVSGESRASGASSQLLSS